MSPGTDTQPLHHPTWNEHWSAPWQSKTLHPDQALASSPKGSAISRLKSSWSNGGAAAANTRKSKLRRLKTDTVVNSGSFWQDVAPWLAAMHPELANPQEKV